MKKYVKPDLYFESFQLTQHIAACGYDQYPAGDDKNASQPEICAFQGDVSLGNMDGVYFTGDNNKCVIKSDIYCYTNGTDTEQIKIFNS